MVYRIGEWKRSTLITLERLKEQNDKNNRPSAGFFRNGAIAHWLSLLKESGYIDNGDGYKINDKGITLLEQLRANPPSNKRKRRSDKPINPAPQTTPLRGHYTFEIKGTDFNVKFPIKSSPE